MLTGIELPPDRYPDTLDLAALKTIHPSVVKTRFIEAENLDLLLNLLPEVRILLRPYTEAYYVEDMVEAWRKYASLPGRYHQSIIGLELGNEPNHPSGPFKEQVGAYADELNKFFDKIPVSLTLLKLISPGLTPYEQTARYNAVLSVYDSLWTYRGIHVYYEGDTQLEALLSVLQALPISVRNKLVCTEFGDATKNSSLRGRVLRNKAALRLMQDYDIQLAVQFILDAPHFQQYALPASAFQEILHAQDTTMLKDSDLYAFWLNEGGSGDLGEFMAHLRAIGKPNYADPQVFGYPTRKGADLQKVKRLLTQALEELNT